MHTLSDFDRDAWFRWPSMMYGATFAPPSVFGVALAANGTCFAGVSDLSVKQWRLPDGADAGSDAKHVLGVPLVGHAGPVGALATDAEGRWVFTGSGDTTVRARVTPCLRSR